MESLKSKLLAGLAILATAVTLFAQAPITKISQYPEATSVDGTELVILAVTNVPTATNKNSKLINFTRMIQPFMTNLAPYINTNNYATTNALAQATNSLAAYARTLTNGFYGNELTNGLAGLTYVTAGTNTLAGYARGLTNGFVGTEITNGLAGLNYVVASTNTLAGYARGLTNGLAGLDYVVASTNTLAGYARGLTNGFVGTGITNGLAGLDYVVTSTNTLAGYARGLTNGFVGPGITNGLAGLDYVVTSTNTLAGYARGLTNGFVGTGITNGLAGLDHVANLTTNSIPYTSGNLSFTFGNTPTRTATNGVTANTTYTFLGPKAGTYIDLMLMGSTINSTDYTTSWVWPANTHVIWLNGTNTSLTHARTTQFAFKCTHVGAGTNIIVVAWKESAQ